MEATDYGSELGPLQISYGLYSLVLLWDSQHLKRGVANFCLCLRLFFSCCDASFRHDMRICVQSSCILLGHAQWISLEGLLSLSLSLSPSSSPSPPLPPLSLSPCLSLCLCLSGERNGGGVDMGERAGGGRNWRSEEGETMMVHNVWGKNKS